MDVKSIQVYKQVSRFVIVKGPYQHIIAKLYFEQCKEDKHVHCQIGVYNYFEGKGLDRNAVETIKLSNNAINTFLKFILSSNTFFESQNLKTKTMVIAEKIRNGNKLYIVQKGENQNWINYIELECKKEIDSLRKKLVNCKKTHSV